MKQKPQRRQKIKPEGSNCVINTDRVKTLKVKSTYRTYYGEKLAIRKRSFCFGLNVAVVTVSGYEHFCHLEHITGIRVCDELGTVMQVGRDGPCGPLLSQFRVCYQQG